MTFEGYYRPWLLILSIELTRYCRKETCDGNITDVRWYCDSTEHNNMHDVRNKL